MADVTELRPSTTPAPAGVEPTTYAFVITIQIGIGGGGFVLFESFGTWNATPGSSRIAAYRQIRQEVLDDAAQKGYTGPAQTVLWSLELEAL